METNKEKKEKTQIRWKMVSIVFLLLSAVCVFLPQRKVINADGFWYRDEFIEEQNMPDTLSDVYDWIRTNAIAEPYKTTFNIVHRDGTEIESGEVETDEMISDLLTLYEAPFSDEEYLQILLRMKNHLMRGTFTLLQGTTYAMDEERFYTLQQVFRNDRMSGYAFSNIVPYYEYRLKVVNQRIDSAYKRLAVLGAGFLISLLLTSMNAHLAPAPYALSTLLFECQGGFSIPFKYRAVFDFYVKSTIIPLCFFGAIVIFIVTWILHCRKQKEEMLTIKKIDFSCVLKLLAIIPITIAATALANHTPTLGKVSYTLDEQGLRYCIHEDRATVIGMYYESVTDGQEVIIPEAINGYPVVSIAYMNLNTDFNRSEKKISKLIVPESVSVIWEHALYSDYEFECEIAEGVLVLSDT